MVREEFEEHLRVLQKTPEKLARLTRGFTDFDFRWKPPNDEFSALENLCHLRDIELQGYTARINRILLEIAPSLPDIDGSQLAIELDYNSQNPEEALWEFAAARNRNIKTLTGISQEQLDREGNLAGVGAVTLAKLLVMMSEHDESHARDLRMIRDQLSLQVD